jgi:hypothetical protein
VLPPEAFLSMRARSDSATRSEATRCGDVAHAHIGEPHRPKLRGYIRGIGARGFVHEHRAIAPGLGTRRGGSQ